MSALFNFQSLLTVLLLLICTCAYVRSLMPSIIDRNKVGRCRLGQSFFVFLGQTDEMFRSKIAEEPDEEGKAAELRQLLSTDASRFKVTNISESQDGSDGKFALPRFDLEDYGDGSRAAPGHSPQHNTYVYDTKSASKNLNHFTREVLPRLEHYKDDNSVNRAQRPTLDELHYDAEAEKVTRKTVEEDRDLQGKVIKFGWLDGVFMRCLLNIWGVMLFLRLSWVIGQAGILEGVAIICLGNLVTLVTTISMSAVCTNGQIKGGGVYYMISRSLGPQFGGAIGLMFTVANAIAVAMYIVGFCESLQDLVRSFGATMIDGGTNDIRVVGFAVLILILVLAMVGMEWVTRTQMILLIVLLLSQVMFIIGSIIGPKTDEEISRGFVGYSAETFEANLGPEYAFFEGTEHDFFSVFAVFFPAVTGIVAGANLSGDLKDPSSAIPKGTLLAILVTFVSYVGYGVMMGGCALRTASGNVSDLVLGRDEDEALPYMYLSNCTDRECKFGMQNDNQMMELISIWGPIIYGGCFAATLSSAIASLVGAPRVLQALAKDKLYPFIGFFSKGYGANNDPVRGYVLVFIIAMGCIFIAQLNAIAPLLSNFFLAAYALINFSVFHSSVSKSPGWRPAFKYYNAWVSLLGTLLCIAVMFLISWWTALITFVVVITLYLYVSYRKPDANWGSSTQAQIYSLALRSVLELSGMEEHVKNYRPQILVLSGQPGWRPPLVQFAYHITKGLSLLVTAQVVVGERFSQRAVENLVRLASRWLGMQKIKGFFAVSFDSDLEAGAKSLMQSIGIGKLRPNMLLMGYKRDWATCSRKDLLHYFNIIHNALDRHLALGILRLPQGCDYSTKIQDPNMIPVEDDNKEPKEKKKKSKKISVVDAPDTVGDDAEEKKKQRPQRMAFHGNIVRRVEKPLLDPLGIPVAKEVVDSLMQFQRRQKPGNIDVWWLYDDGGLTLLIPYILNTRSIFADCRLRIFSLCVNKDELDQEQRNLAALLSKFRIAYNDVIVIPDIMKKAQTSTRIEFDQMVKDFRIRDDQVTDENRNILISDSEFETLKERNNRHMRLRELLKEHSSDATFVVMTLPMPRRETVSAALYMSWLELLTKGMPPYLIVRGNQNSVLTFYS